GPGPDSPARAAGGDRNGYLRQAATIEEELLGDRAAAIALHREIFERDAADGGSLDALERLHTLESAWPAVVETLRGLLALTTAPPARRALLWRIAELTESRLLRPGEPVDAAVRAYSAVLDEQGDDLPALEALSRLYEAAGRDAELQAVLERRLALAA